MSGTRTFRVAIENAPENHYEYVKVKASEQERMDFSEMMNHVHEKALEQFLGEEPWDEENETEVDDGRWLLRTITREVRGRNLSLPVGVNDERVRWDGEEVR